MHITVQYDHHSVLLERRNGGTQGTAEPGNASCCASCYCILYDVPGTVL